MRQLALELEPSQRVCDSVTSWQEIDAATPTDRALQIGFWITAESRWQYLFHTAWNNRMPRPGFYCDDDLLKPSHWRDIGKPHRGG